MNELTGLIDKFRALDPHLEVTFNAEQTAVALLRGKLSPAGNVEELRQAPYESARRFLRENKALLSGLDDAKELVDERVTAGRSGITHVVFSQKHGTAKVLGGRLSVHYGAEGSVNLIKSDLALRIDAPKRAKVTLERAIDIAREDAGAGAQFYEGHKPALVVVDAETLHQEGDRKYYLCWQMRIAAPEQSRAGDQIYLVDAEGGRVLLHYPAVQTGTGTGYYSQGTALNSEAAGGTYRLRDTPPHAAWPVANHPAICTYDDAGSRNLSLTDYSEDADDNWDNGGVTPTNRQDDQRAEVDIHRFAGYVAAYYYLTHGHNSWDNAGADVRVHAHNMYPGWMPNNAFWDPGTQQIYFGDGDNVKCDFFTTLDAVGHEFTHGVIYHFNILQINDGESGANNEALADLGGYLVALDYPADCPEPWNLLGGCYKTGRGRNIADPSRDGAGVVHYDATDDTTKYNSVRNGYYPDHYSIRYTGAEDHHGVHANSTIIAHALYLMIQGGTHRLSGVTVSGMGVAPVEQMLYEVMSGGLLTDTSDFADLRLAFLIACQMLFPGTLGYLITVKAAFDAVGIGPDLYIRDTLTDQGAEPGVYSCMSPDIIVRRQLADAATRALIGDPNNDSLCEEMEWKDDSSQSHYVYFRVFNRGSDTSSGRLRLFVVPSTPFAAPATWTEVGQYHLQSIPGQGGMWVPSHATDCITLPGSLIDALGPGNFCFIAIIECALDPAPDRNLISDIVEFRRFIKCNNYAFRSCCSRNVLLNLLDQPDGISGLVHIHGFDPGFHTHDRWFEIDVRDLPEGTDMILWVPETRFVGLKAFEVGGLPFQATAPKTVGVLDASPLATAVAKPTPLNRLATVANVEKMAPPGIKWEELKALRPLRLEPRTVMRLKGLAPPGKGTTDVRFVVKFPKGVGTRDVTLSFRERSEGTVIGQMNYVFRIRPC